eukprot:GEZU01024196.1.p2 GENE.GEZU01024196.1~~GEZU01024196.1.p2  ORF type:complete len:213 (+),score=55.64 GEZU01024196.1:282-920(+)
MLVSAITGKVIVVPTSSDMTVRQLKERIHEKEGMDTEQMKLVYHGMPMEDYAQLGDYYGHTEGICTEDMQIERDYDDQVTVAEAVVDNSALRFLMFPKDESIVTNEQAEQLKSADEFYLRFEGQPVVQLTIKLREPAQPVPADVYQARRTIRQQVAEFRAQLVEHCKSRPNFYATVAFKGKLYEKVQVRGDETMYSLKHRIWNMHHSHSPSY